MKAVIQEKQAIVDTITKEIQDNQSAIVVEYRGLPVAKLEELRRLLRKEKVALKVYKNTLVSRAASSLGYGDLDKSLVGPNAVVFSKEDPIAGPRILTKFAKKNKQVVVKGGIFEGRVLSDKEVVTVAGLPGRNGLLSMLLSCMNAPLTSLACAIKAVAEAKETQN